MRRLRPGYTISVSIDDSSAQLLRRAGQISVRGAARLTCAAGELLSVDIGIL